MMFRGFNFFARSIFPQFETVSPADRPVGGLIPGPWPGTIRGMIRRVARIVLVNFALLLAVAVAAELLFGHWFSRDPLDRLDIFRNGRTMVDARPLYPGGRTFLYRRDQWGLRGAGVDPAAVAVLTIGGSTTNQMYLEEDATWQAAAARALASRGRPVVFANAGLDGQSTLGHLRNFDAWFPNVPGLKPKVIIAYVGLNDLAAGGLSIDALAFSSTLKQLRYNSALIRAGRVVEGWLAARRARLNHRKVDYARAEWTETPNFPDARPPDTRAYAARLRELVGRIGALGAKPVLMTQMSGDVRLVDGRARGLAAKDGPNGPNGIDRWRQLAAFNAATLAVCRETGAACLDLAGEVVFEDRDFYDEVHNTPQGAEKIGRWLAERLAGML